MTDDTPLATASASAGGRASPARTVVWGAMPPAICPFCGESIRMHVTVRMKRKRKVKE